MASRFIDKAVKPTNKMLSDELGRSYKYWEAIKKSLENQFGSLTEEWKFYSASSGWTLKLLLKRRNLFFFAPCKKYFRIAFIFGDKAVAEVEASDLPVDLIRELREAKRYVEGRALRLEIRTKADVKNVVKLARIKVRN